MRFLRYILCGVAFSLAGCATAYQSTGFTGGFSETRLAPDMFRVRFSGNGFTTTERAEDLVLLRAADLTAGAGYTFFAIVGQNSGGSQTAIETPGTSVTTVSGGRHGFIGASTYIPGQTINVFKPRTGLTIKCFPKRLPGVDVFDAKFLQQEIRKKYQIAD